ncbi:MAG: C25 family cysteine peptidase [Candidatus Eisenbacteria bacterium]
MRLRSIATLVLGILILVVPTAYATSFLEHALTLDPARVSVTQSGGFTVVEAKGSMREFAPGHPDLPWLSERIDIPQGARVTSVEVIDVTTAILAEGARLQASIAPQPGLGPIIRTEPAAAYFTGPAFQPERLVELGAQGGLRGLSVAFVRWAPVRWSPATGRLERVASMRLRLTLESGAEPPIRRERIVREWEDELPPMSAKEAATVLRSATPGIQEQAEPFRPQQVPSVLGSPVAYLIITSDAMAPTFQQLADWKTQSGVPAVVRTVSFITQQYPYGVDDADRIRRFIRDAYSRWGTKWVLLGGDTDVIPERLATTLFYGGESIASDLYFQALDGNWNADGDSLYGEGYLDVDDPGDACDLLPEVYVGRAPVSSAADAQVFVNKTLQYSKTPVGGYESRYLAFAEVLFPQDWQPGQGTSLDGAELVEELLPIFDQRPDLPLRRLYQNYLDARWRPGSVVETRQAVLDSLNRGYNVAIHVGHGYRNIMSVGDASLTNADAAGLTNGNKLINLYAINCTSNAIDFPCIGEAFIKNPTGGAVTNVGSTRFDFPTAGRAYQAEYFRLFIEDSITAVGELQSRQKLPYIAFSTYDGVNRWTQMTLLMLGDPELRMWSGNWRTLTVSHPGAVAISDSSFTVNVSVSGVPLSGARVVAYRAGDEFRIATTNGAGNAVVPFRPDSLGTFVLTVTAFNAKPYQANVTISASGSASLADGAVVIDDDNVGGTVGDSDGKLNAGETVDLRVPVSNRGGGAAASIQGSLTTTDPLVSIVVPAVAYGTISAGGTTNPATGFRVNFPYTLIDQREVPFKLTLVSGAQSWTEDFQLTVRSPDLMHNGHVETETGGNNNGRPEVNETVTYQLKLRNHGTGIARGVSIKLRSYDGLAEVSDSTATFADIATGVTATGDGVTFKPLSSAAKLSIIVSDAFGERFTKRLDLSFPAGPVSLLGVGKATSVALTWGHSAESDLRGYNIYRSSTQFGTYTKVNPTPSDRTSYYLDENLSPLTRYYYKVSAVDSSGNESSLSSLASAGTNPPVHSIFPVPMDGNTPSSVALEYIYQSSQMDIVVGAEHMFVMHADGSAPVDADNSEVTLGDFSSRGKYFAAAPSVATLDGNGWSIIAPSWDSSAVYVFDKLGNVRAGWPLYISNNIWSSAAVGDLNGDGASELAFGSNGVQFYVMRADGTEWSDGDANPTTKGVFKNLGSGYNFGTPAMADIDGDNLPEIVYGGFDGKLYAWKANGTNVPGFPLITNGAITCSPAVGYLDGPGDTSPEIIFASSNDSLYVLQADGKRRAGWPVWTRSSGSSKCPSPALADINNDGFVDIVWQSTNGGLYVWNRNGTLIPPFGNLRYSVLSNGASESSPVVGDIDGDGRPDIVVGDEFGLLTAFSGLNGTIMPGFPIQTQAEIRGAAALGDIDRDGKTEIVLAGWDKNLYVWDYDFPYSPAGPAPWPQFHHDARRTGFMNAPLFVGVDEGADLSGLAPGRVDFAPITPNPTRGTTRARLWFGIPADLAGHDYELAVFDLTGRRVKTVDSGLSKAGRFSLEWDMRDDQGRSVQGGVYFARFTVGGKSASRKLVVLD